MGILLQYGGAIMDRNKKWIVTISGNQSLSDVKKSLTETGFTVEQVLDQIGCITGFATDDIAARLRMMPGVADVSPDTDMGIGPPHDSITW